MDQEQTYPLLEQIKHYNLEFLIPLHFNSDDDDAEGYCHTHSDMDRTVFDPTEYEYYDDFDFGEGNNEVPDDFEYDDGNVNNLDDFCRIFNADYLDYEELMNTNIWDLFGITKKQFDLINWDAISPADFAYFYTRLTEDKRDISVEQKILYATVATLTDYPAICTYGPAGCNHDELIKYCEHIIDTHTMGQVRELMNLLIDYWRFYDDALEMNHRRALTGEQQFKYVPMPKPSHIRDLHHKAFQDHMTMETERMAENRKRINREIKRVAQSHDYQRFLYTDGKYVVKPVMSQDDLDHEGEYLKHCVASYGSYMARAESFIYLVRPVKNPDVPYFTAEILPPKKRGERYKLNQFYTFKDSTDKTSDLREFVREWAAKKGFTIKCEI